MEAARCEKLLDELEDSVKKIKSEFSSASEPVTDDSLAVQSFCTCSEKMLRHGMKDRLSFFSTKDYWDYLLACLGSERTFSVVVRGIQDIAELQTSVGRGRAFIRLCLVDHSLADALQYASNKTKVTSEWYHPDALVRTEQLLSRCLDLLYELNDVVFELPNFGHNLDKSWPTFARRTFDGDSTRRISLSAKISGRSGSKGRSMPEVGEAVSPELEANDEAIIPTAASIDVDTTSEWAAHGVQAMDKMAWMALHKIIHQLLANENGSVEKEDESSGTGIVLSERNSSRLKDLAKLIQDCRQVWQKSHDEEVQLLESRCSDLAEQLEEKTTSEELLTVELSAMRQQGVDWKQAAVSSEVQKVRKKLKQAETARDTAENQAAMLQKNVQELKEQVNSLEEKLKASQEEKVLLEQQLRDAETSVSSLTEDGIRAKQELGEELSELRKEHRRASDCLQAALVQEMASTNTEVGADLTSSIRKLHSRLQEESLQRAEARDNERKAREECAKIEGHFEQELTTVKFRLSAESMQLQQVRELVADKDKEIEQLSRRVSEAEQQQDVWQSKVSSLEKDTSQALYEKEEYQRRVTRLEASLAANQKEVFTLEDQLLSATRDRDAERVNSLKLNNDFEKLSEKCSNAERKMHELQDEVLLLRKQLIQATQQKADLVDKTAILEDEVMQEATKKWMPDEETDACLKCAVEFSLFLRRHHCRHCGRVFCDDCCNKTFKLTASNTPSRVCDDCHSVLTARQQGQLTPAKYSFTSSMSLSSSMSLTPGRGGDYSPKRFQSASVRRGLDESFAGALQSSRFKSLQSEEDPRLTQSCQVNGGRWTPPGVYRPRAILGRQTPPTRLQNLDNPSPVPPASLAGRLRSSSTTSDLPSPTELLQDIDYQEVSVPPAGVHGFSLTAQESTDRIAWEFETERKGITFGVTFRQSEEILAAAAETLLPLRRYKSHKQVVSGSLSCQQPGVYSLQFANSSAATTAVKLFYRTILVPR